MKRHEQFWQATYRHLMDRGFERCRICNASKSLTFEHILPRSRGGIRIRSNMTILCASCNNAKGNSMIDFEHLVWPPPGFTIKLGCDLQAGDVVQCGKILSIEIDSKVACEVDTSYSTLGPGRRDSRLTLKLNQEVLIVPRSVYEVTRMVGVSELGEGRQRQA